MDDALRALDQKIADTTKLLEESQDKAERDRIAHMLEQEADAVEKASRAVAERLIMTRLRTKAGAIRSGHEPAVLPSAPPEPARRVGRPPAQRNVLFLQPVRYTGRFGQPVLHHAWVARVPAPVAEAAIEQGLAMDADTDAAREKMTEMAESRPRTSRSPAVTIEKTIDLGVNLAEKVEPSRCEAKAVPA